MNPIDKCRSIIIAYMFGNESRAFNPEVSADLGWTINNVAGSLIEELELPP